MNPPKNCYHIIKFSSGLPYPTCCGYECIPHSWVTFHDPAKGAAVIAFPRRPVDASDDIRCSRKYDPSWSKFVVQVIFSTENFEEAHTSLKLFQTDTTSDTVPEEQSTDGAESQGPQTCDPPPSETTTERIPPSHDQPAIPSSKTKPAKQTPSILILDEAKTKPANQTEPRKNPMRRKQVIIRPNKKVIKRKYKKRINQQINNENKQSLPGDSELFKTLDEIESKFNAAQEILFKLIKDSDKCSKLTSKAVDVMNLNNGEPLYHKISDKLTPCVSVNRLDLATTKKLRKSKKFI